MSAYGTAKDFKQGFVNKGYQDELNAIPTPEQAAAKRAEADIAKRTAATTERQSKTGGSFPQVSLVGDMNAKPSTKPGPAGGITKSAGASNIPTQTNNIPSQPNIADTIEYLKRRAEVDLRHGKMDTAGLVNLQNTLSNMKAEGLHSAVALMNKGDALGGVNAYNSMGNHRLKLVEQKDGQFEVGGVKIPTKLVTLEDEKGNRETINTAHFLNSAVGLEKLIEQAQAGFENKTDRIGADADAVKADASMIKANADKKKSESDASKKPEYKVEGGEVATVLGDPVLRKDGTPKLDPITGRQLVNRNTAKEKAFYRWMSEQGITDTNEGLAIYMAQNPEPLERTPTRKPGVKASDFD